MRMTKRFFKTLLFYCRAVGVRNTLFVELPSFIRMAKEDGLPDESLFWNLVDVMEDCQECYLG